MNSIFHDIKTAMAVALTTAMTGIMTILDLMPDVYIAKVAALTGIVLSFLLIRFYLIKIKAEQIELAKKQKEVEKPID